MKRLGLGIAVVAIGLTLPAFGQGVDPYIGTWKLNVEKSTVVGVPLDRSITLTITGEGGTFTNNSEGVDAQGQPFKIVFRHIYDGMPHPTTGNPNYDSTIYTRIGNTINATRFRQGKPVEIGQGVIVPGKTYTFTEEGINVNNQPYPAVLVFDRQQSLRDQLVGTWRTVSCTNSALPMYCVKPNVLLVYDASGHYVFINAQLGRPKASGRPVFTSPAEEIKATVQGFAANFGTWTYNEADRTITTHVEAALFPNNEGNESKATVVSVTGDELRLAEPNGEAVLRRVSK